MKEEKNPLEKVVNGIFSFFKDHVKNKDVVEKNLKDFKKIFGSHERFKNFKKDEELKPFSLILLGLRIYYETMSKKFDEKAANYVLASSESYEQINKIEKEELKDLICFSIGCVEAAVLSGDLKREQADKVLKVVAEKSVDYLE